MTDSHYNTLWAFSVGIGRGPTHPGGGRVESSCCQTWMFHFNILSICIDHMDFFSVKHTRSVFYVCMCIYIYRYITVISVILEQPGVESLGQSSTGKTGRSVSECCSPTALPSSVPPLRRHTRVWSSASELGGLKSFVSGAQLENCVKWKEIIPGIIKSEIWTLKLSILKTISGHQVAENGNQQRYFWRSRIFFVLFLLNAYVLKGSLTEHELRSGH